MVGTSTWNGPICIISCLCQLKQAGTMCRGPAGACDLPEYCTGASPYCPANVYLLDGSSCQYGVAYCYNGMCLTHQQQCLQLWGYGNEESPSGCNAVHTRSPCSPETTCPNTMPWDQCLSLWLKTVSAFTSISVCVKLLQWAAANLKAVFVNALKNTRHILFPSSFLASSNVIVVLYYH